MKTWLWNVSNKITKWKTNISLNKNMSNENTEAVIFDLCFVSWPHLHFLIHLFTHLHKVFLSTVTNTLLFTKTLSHMHVHVPVHQLSSALSSTTCRINPVAPTGDAAHHIDGRTYRKNPFVLFEQTQQRRAAVPVVRPHRRRLPLWPGSEKWSQAESLAPNLKWIKPL